jgi:putative PIN family toxin of toxin-antitoxin system
VGPEAKALRVVLDTNVTVSAVLFERGRLTWIRDAWMAERITPLIDRPCLDELLRVLAYPKFRLDEGDVTAILGSYLPWTETVEEGGPVCRLPRCSDPDDRKFLELAARGRAEVLVTGDADLLDLEGRAPFGIETPARFRGRLMDG